jgi:hypothetical protein
MSDFKKIFMSLHKMTHSTEIIEIMYGTSNFCSQMLKRVVNIRGRVQKFPNWPLGERELQMVQLSATRCSGIAIF